MEIKMQETADSDVKTNDTKVTTSILDAFDLLRASNEDDKLTGGAKIISQLQNNTEVDSKNFKYVLKRLVRSLGANVPDTRTGYFATLVALLTKVESVPVSELLNLIKKELHASNASKSEVGDVALGQILVCSAVFRSGLMLRSTEVEQKEILSILLTASKKKSYLGTVAYLILLDFAKTLNEDNFSSIIWSNIKQDFKKDLKEYSLDLLYFVMVVSKKFKKQVNVRKLVGNPEIICEDNIQDICEKLMAGIDFNSISHPIFTEIGVQVANSSHLLQFWNGIDSQLGKHNRNRELAALSILSAILSNLKENVEVLPEIMSKNFFKLFMDWFKGLQTASKIRNKRDDEDDHKIMIKKEKEVLTLLAKAIKLPNVTNKIRLDMLKKLLFQPGEINFTEITGSTLVRSIISDLDKDGVKKMAKSFKGVLLNTTKKLIKDDVERNWYNNERLKAAEHLSYLVSHESVKDDTDFKLSYMKLLMCFGFFKISGDANVAISTDLSGAIKTCFYRCFTSRFSNVDSLVIVLNSLCDFISSSLKKEQIRTKIEKQFPKQSMECWEMLTAITQNLENKEPKSKIDKVFLILLYQLGLFLFSEPSHVKVARSSIKELKSCYEHFKKENKSKKTKTESDEPEWIEVLVEVLLSILSVESSVLRSVVQCVFRLLWEFLTPSSVGQIVSVLDPESNTNPLLHDSDSENEESDSEDKNNEENEMSESDSNTEEEDDDDDEEEMKIPDQLRIAVQNALGGAATESDTESLDADMINEEEGKKLDEALAEAFKQYSQAKGKKTKKDRKNKKALSDFRIRVLDLIDIYLEKDPAMDICLAMIAPLMRSLEFCIQDSQFRELENRVRKTIKLLTKVRKFSSTEGITVDILCDYLKSTIEKGSRSHFLFQAIGDVVTHFTTFIIYCSLKIEVVNPKSPKKSKSTSPLVEVLKEAFHNYFHNRSCLLPIIFFHSILQIEWDSNFALLPIIIQSIFNSDVRQFRRNEGVELISGFYRALKRSKPSDKVMLTKLSNVEATFENTLTKSLSDDSNFEVKQNFIVVLKKLVNTMKMFHEYCNVETTLDFSAILRTIGSYKNTIKNKKNNGNDIKNKDNNTKKSKRKKRKLEKVNGHSEPFKKKVKINSSDKSQ